MKLLFLDIETRPNVVHKWSLYDKVPTGLNQVIEFAGVFAFAAKWQGKPKVEFYSDHHNGHSTMVEQAYRLLNEADVVCHYNGTSFDMPWLRTEIALADIGVPSPVQEIDLYRVIRKKFRFPSNKLQHISQAFELGSKVSHSGHDLWVRCLDGDPKAWALMKRYNIGDVRLTEQLHDRILPWIHNYPHRGLFTGEDYRCACGAGRDQLQRRGSKPCGLSIYPQFMCNVCGSWFRGKTAIGRIEERGVA